MITPHNVSYDRTATTSLKIQPSHIAARTTEAYDALIVVPISTDPMARGALTGTYVFGNDAPNYLKMIPLVSTASLTCTIRVIGWSKVQDLGSEITSFWIPHIICVLTGVSQDVGTSFNLGGIPMFQVSTLTLVHGDAGILSDPTVKVGGLFLVDPVGIDVIEFNIATSAGGQSANLCVGGL